MELKEDDPEVVKHFIDWLYAKKCEFNATISKAAGCDIRFAFADKICAEAYCNDIVDAVRADYRIRHIFVNSKQLHSLYKQGLRGSELAKFGLKSAVYEATKWPANFAAKEYSNEWWSCAELMQDFVEEMMEFQKKEWSQPYQWTGCQFHCHKDGSPCSAAK